MGPVVSEGPAVPVGLVTPVVLVGPVMPVVLVGSMVPGGVTTGPLPHGDPAPDSGVGVDGDAGSRITAGGAQPFRAARTPLVLTVPAQRRAA